MASAVLRLKAISLSRVVLVFDRVVEFSSNRTSACFDSPFGGVILGSGAADAVL